MARRGYSNTAYPIYLVGSLDGTAATSVISVSTTSGGAPAAPTGWPVVPYYIAIDPETPSEEIALVTAVAGSSLTITRATTLGSAAYGSTTKEHSAGAKIAHVATASDFDEANSHVNAITGVHGLGGSSSVVGTTDTQTLSNKTLSATTGVSGGGTVVGTSGAQTLTNKVLGTGSSVSSAATIDAAAALTAGGAIVGTTATQTLSNKTLSAPTLSGTTTAGAINSGALAVTGTLSTTGDLTAPNITGAWEAYAVTWAASGTAPALGNGTLTGRFRKMGRTVHYLITLTAGSTTTYGTGSWTFTLPSAAATTMRTQAQGRDVSAGLLFMGMSVPSGGTVVPYLPSSGTSTNLAAVNATVPWTWANTDELWIWGTYESAA